ncbi:hypothetical protein [Halobacillus mangrovi]|uniref:Resolvase/invertase-type recombinase catalytic domain-containing protein n=1 Tax=Halobacillus mangrovi TaxID=402384 RepID=A0A1W5ZQT8_9BACI|nr:hypothetical protein [Halobacillus mangrovi]ARI75648.1 hypothetical protein HM131_01875 [Halobacillus mangrovi]
MSNIAVYYRLANNEDTNRVIQCINKELHNFNDQHVIKGVFVDAHRERYHFNDLISRPLHEIDILFINEIIHDEFDWKLINQLSITEGFTIQLLGE